MDRFYCPDLAEGGVRTLPESEARHVRQVLRKPAGEAVVLFDGQGRSAEATLETVDRHGVCVRPAEVRTEPVPASSLIVAAAVPKADRLKWMAEKLTELGVRRFVPMQCARSVVEPRATKLEKLTQTVVSACKQCGRDRLMEIADPTPLADVLSMPADRRLIADVLTERRAGGRVEGTTLVLVGPEGGWTDEERAAAADAGFEAVGLATTVLRTETAAIAAAAVLA